MALSNWARLLPSSLWNLDSHGVHLSLLVFELFIDQLLSLALSSVFVKSLCGWHRISIFHQLNNLLGDRVNMGLSYLADLLVHSILLDFERLQVCIFQESLLIAQKVVKITRLVISGSFGSICLRVEVALGHLSGVLVFSKLSYPVVLEL